MSKLTSAMLLKACSPGGSSCLTSRTDLGPAAGDHAGVAPARYVSAAAGGKTATFAFETRFIDDGPAKIVLLDGKSSSINRIEQAISLAITDGNPLLGQTPRITVTYPDLPVTACYDLPHRAWDGHIRAGTINGHLVPKDPTYRQARDATPANARALLELSPTSLVLGSWDATRRSHAAKYRSALTGEIIGVLADQDDSGLVPPRRGGARVDSLAPSVQLTAEEMESLVAAQEDELSERNVTDIREAIRRGVKSRHSGSTLGLGSIPPTLSSLGLVACQRIIRHHVLSFAALRQLRFGAGVEGDAACRALLAAWALNGLARSQAELILRANCDLVEKEAPGFTLDLRYGQSEELDALSIEAADDLLGHAIDRAVDVAGIRWEGQIFAVTGNRIVAGGIVDDVEEQ